VWRVCALYTSVILNCCFVHIFDHICVPVIIIEIEPILGTVCARDLYLHVMHYYQFLSAVIQKLCCKGGFISKEVCTIEIFSCVWMHVLISSNTSNLLNYSNKNGLHITTIRSSLLMFPLTPDQHHWLEVATEDDAVLRRALPLGRGLGRTKMLISICEPYRSSKRNN